MQLRNLIVLILAWLFMAATCERPVDLDIEKPKDRIVLSSIFTLGEKVKVEVSRSKNIFEDIPDEDFADAHVSIFQGTELIEELVFVIPPQEHIRPYFTTTIFEPQPSITYTIKAEVDGFDPVFAHSFIPIPVPITSFSVTSLEERPATNGYSILYDYDIFFDFDDPISEENYYHLNIFQEIIERQITNIGDPGPDTTITKIWKRANLELDKPGVVSDAIVGGLLFADNPCPEGFDFNLSIEIVPELNQSLGKAFVEFRTVSKEYYLFYNSFNRRQNQKDGPFTDPITVFNNIENGQGYFAGYNATQDSVFIEF